MHILDIENSMVKSLNKRLGAVKKIQKISSFRTSMNGKNNKKLPKPNKLLRLLGKIRERKCNKICE